MFDDVEGHLVNLERLSQRAARRAYIILILAAARAGYDVVARAGDASHSVLFRAADDHHPYGLTLLADQLVFTVRRPGMVDRPGLAAQALDLFPGRTRGAEAGSSEIRITVANDDEAEQLVEWLFGGAIIPGYAERISA